MHAKEDSSSPIFSPILAPRIVRFGFLGVDLVVVAIGSEGSQLVGNLGFWV